MIKIDYEAQRLERRDVALATEIGSSIEERYYAPDLNPQGQRDMVRIAAQQAAYEAIQREREYHAEDMQALRSASDLRTMLAQLTTPVLFIPAPKD